MLVEEGIVQLAILWQKVPDCNLLNSHEAIMKPYPSLVISEHIYRYCEIAVRRCHLAFHICDQCGFLSSQSKAHSCLLKCL